jgi:3-methylfumaryl-CoA hydratase
MTSDYSAWVGKTEESDDFIALAPTLAAAAMLDDTTTRFADGAALPPLWHWFYFLPKAPQSKIGVDGHPQRGGFMPPIDLPRRMFAGARLRFLEPLRAGDTAHRVSTIRDVQVKEGKTGRLAFVTVKHAISQQGRVCIEEEQDIVYREPGARVPAPEVVALPPAPAGAWTRRVKADPVLLFRFSALTFNAHRIHYDRDYATQEEGYPGLVVHGPLTAVLLLELVRFNTKRRVAAFSFRGQAPLFDLAPFRLVALPKDDGVQLEAQGPDGKVTLAAQAELG